MDPLTVYPGAEVYFCYTVTNTGGAAVNDITIADTLYGVAIPVPGTLSLLPGASGALISAPVLISEDATDSARATGDAGGYSVSSELASATVLVDESSLSLAVKASLDPICGNADDADLLTVLAGTSVYFCYTVVNTGETTVSGVSVDDPLADALTLYSGEPTLLSGDIAIFRSGLVTVLDDTTRAATAFGIDGFGFPVESPLDDASVDAIAPALALVKTVSLDGRCPGSEVAYILEGQTVTFCYAVTNTGDTAIDAISVNDGGLVLSIGSLQPGQSATVSSSFGVIEDTATFATASGLDAVLGSAVETAPALASVFVVRPALAIQTTVSLDGYCPGEEVVNVLEDTELTWCFEVTNTGDVGIANISLTDSAYGALDGGLPYLAPGESAFLARADTAAFDLLLSALASGTADLVGAPVQSAPDVAAVNVVYPGLNIDVTVSLDGTCPGSDSVAAPAGTLVFYCYTVTNLGDEALADVTVSDSLLGFIGATGPLASGESVTLGSGPVALVEDRTSEATAAGSDVYGFPVSDSDTAIVDALFADIAVEKSAPPKLLTSLGRELTYAISVTNLGEAPAVNVVVSDALPTGLVFLAAETPEGVCGFEAGVVTCALGEVPPAGTATILIFARAEIAIGALVNTASATSDTPDRNPSNNSSTVRTLVAPGATRTIGFYGTHPSFVAWCIDVNGGAIDLGFTRVADESVDDEIDRDRDRDRETALELAMGVLNANVSRLIDKTKRTPLDQARMQSGRQVLVALCNASLLGGEPGFDLAGAPAILAGTDIPAILAIGANADAFNNSGTELSLGVPTGQGTPKYPWDDPTDPND
jgi:uncharacterized repeat protein (TIGR01451 family)